LLDKKFPQKTFLYFDARRQLSNMAQKKKAARTRELQPVGEDTEDYAADELLQGETSVNRGDVRANL